MFRIGFLDPSNASGRAVLMDGFRQELSKLGWIEGKNISIEYRFVEKKNDRMRELAAELVRLSVDLIVTTGMGRRSQRRKHHYYSHRDDDVFGPRRSRAVASLARLGGNVTGAGLVEALSAPPVISPGLHIFPEN